MQKNWWIWLFGPAAVTTALLVGIAVAIGDGDQEAGPAGPVSLTTTTPPVETPEPTTTSVTQTTTTTSGVPPAATAQTAPTTTSERSSTRPPASKRPVTLAQVPDLLGATPSQAITELERAGFRAKVRREQSLQPDGTVFEQTPRPGERVRRGWTIRLTVASHKSREPPRRHPPAPPVSTMPRLVGLDYSEAATRMEILGIVANSYPVQSSERVTIVIGQNPVPGVQASRGSRVRLTVSLGRSPLQQARVPDTVGLSELQAHARCREEHFTCRSVDVSGSGSGAGRVVRQRPPAGQVERALTQMILYVGR